MPGQDGSIDTVYGDMPDIGTEGKHNAGGLGSVLRPARRISAQRFQRLSNHQSW